MGEFFVVFGVVVVDLWFVGAGFAEDLGTECVGHERFNVGSAVLDDQVKHVCRFSVSGDEVGSGLADAEVEDLHRGWPGFDRDFAGGYGESGRVMRCRSEDGDGAVEDLVGACVHAVAFFGRDDELANLIAPA